MLLSDSNKVLREAIVEAFFFPQLKKLGYKKTKVKHPALKTEGLSKNKIIHMYFDLDTGIDYPDGDEWFIVEYLLPYDVNLPDSLKNPDYFANLASEKGSRNWRHRELVRYRYGKVKKLDEALAFIDRKSNELWESLRENAVLSKIDAAEK